MKAVESKTSSLINTSKTPAVLYRKGRESFFAAAKTQSENTFFASSRPFFNFSNNQFIQAKLSVGQPDDPYEREANRTADTVADGLNNTKKIHKKSIPINPAVSPARSKGAESTPEHKLQKDPDKNQLPDDHDLRKKEVFESNGEQAGEGNTKGIHPGKYRKEEYLQAKNSDRTSSIPPGKFESDLASTKGSGSPLPNSTRQQMESSFGADFSGVRIHDNSSAVQLNKELHANAFTHGKDIYFNSNKYDVNSKSGNHLLAHELTHVIQQGESSVKKNQDTENALPKYPRSEETQVKGNSPGVNIQLSEYEFDFSVEGLETLGDRATGYVKDKAAKGLDWIVDKIKALISEGKILLNEKWNSIKAIASSGWDELKNALTNITTLIQSPFNIIANAIANFDTDSLAASWAKFSGTVNSISQGFKSQTERVFKKVSSLWQGISGFVTARLNEVTRITANFLFKRLPDSLQNLANGLISEFKTLWKRISDEWQNILDTLKRWIDEAVAKVTQYLDRIGSFAMNVIIDGIRMFKDVIKFLQDFYKNPQKYIAILAKKAVEAFNGVDGKFSDLVGQFFGDSKKAAPTQQVTGTSQKQPIAGSPPGTKGSSASWGDIGTGIKEVMGKKWNAFKSDPLSIVTGLIMDMVLPMVGNVKDIIQLGKDIWDIVTGPLHAGSLEEFWTSFLLLLQIPIRIYNTIVSILMRSLMLPLIIASFVPHPLVKAFAAAIGYGLLGAFLSGELLNIGQQILLLKTGSTTEDQKQEAYNRISDGLIALAMTAVIMVIMLILHFIANVMKGVYNFIKGKVFRVEVAPMEGKALPEESKALPEESKTTGDELKDTKEATPDSDEVQANLMESDVKLGLDPTPETIRQGSVRMEEHPQYNEVLLEIKEAGFEVDYGSPRASVVEVVNSQGEVIRIEKTIYVMKGMRFLDLEHELGHLRQLTQRLTTDGRMLPNKREVESPYGRTKSSIQGNLLNTAQDAVTEYHNRLVEYLRLKERNVDIEILKDHAQHLKKWRGRYLAQNKNSPTKMKWVEEHFPDISNLETKYTEVGGPGLED